VLQEKRAALITRAVTKGLDPTVPMKDSGVEWLGQIPAHWEVEENRWLFRESDTRSQLGEEILLTVSHITGVTPRAEKPDVTMIEAESHEGYKICCSGELAINTMWAWMGALGIAFQHGMVSPSMCTESPRLGLFRATTTTCVGFRTTSRRSFVTRRESGNRGYGCTRMPSAES
jgi:type I restriction enzyme S subunit